MDALQQQLIFSGGSLLCAGIGSFHDVRERRIPNLLTGPAIAAGITLHALAGGWRGLGDSVLAGLIAGAIFFVFFVVGGMGAGDVKLMAAVGCIVGPAPLHLVVIATVAAGAGMALVVSHRHGKLLETLGNVGVLLQHHGQQGFVPHPELNLSNERTLRLPFALPIFAGCLFTFCMLAWEAHS